MTIGYFDGQHEGNNVVSFLTAQVKSQPTKTAFYHWETESRDWLSITYRQFDHRTALLANGFSTQGVTRSDRVLILAPISVELYSIIIGLQRLGAVPVFLDSFERREQLRLFLENAKPIGIVSLNSFLESANDLLDQAGVKIKVAVDQSSDQKLTAFNEIVDAELQRAFPPVPVDQHDSALITYTTGSSGVPKGVNRTHRFLAAQHYALKRLFPYKSEDIDLPVFPVFTLNNIASGLSTVLPTVKPGQVLGEDPQLMVEQIEGGQVSCLTLSPLVFNNLAHYCRQNNIQLDGLRRVLAGGAPISESNVRSFKEIAPQAEIWILYGSTEVEPISYIESRDMLSSGPEKSAGNVTVKGVNVGRIDTELQYCFINIKTKNVTSPVDLETLKVGPDQIGELIVTGEHVSQKYFTDPVAFQSTKIKDLNGLIWHRTGDLARLDEQGYLWIVGRVHNVIEREGQCYFPVWPELLMKDLPEVMNSAYLTDRANRITAVLTLSAERKKQENEVAETVRELFQSQAIPCDQVVFRSDIPMDVRHHSKVDYNKLRQQLAER